MASFDISAVSGVINSDGSAFFAERPRRTITPISTLSRRTLDQQLSTTVIDDSDNDLSYAITQFVLETTATGQVRQYNVSALGEQTVNLNIGQGVDYSVEISRSNTGDLVAIKHRKLEAEDASISSSARRARTIWKALNEAKIIRHPPIAECSNVISLIGFGWKYVQGSTTMPALVVEFAGEGSLRQYLQKTQMPETEKWNFTLGILKGLSVLHSSGVIHGDTKLENILVATSSGGTMVPKIADFGSSIIISTAEKHFYWGSEKYNAPEVRFSGSRPHAMELPDLLRCEVWAFGLLTLELFLDGKSYLDNETTRKCFDRFDAAALTESCSRQLAQVRFIDSQLESKMSTLLDIALNPIPNLRGSFDDIRSLFNVHEERAIPIPLEKKFVNARGFIDLTDNVNLRTILRGKGVASIIPEKLPWSVQVEIANRYRKLSTINEPSLSGLAHLNLAICFYMGFGLERETRRAVESVQIAALRGIPEAQLLVQPLGELFQIDLAEEDLASVDKDEETMLMLKARSEMPYHAPFRDLLELEKKTHVIQNITVQDLHMAISDNDFELTSNLIRQRATDFQNSKGQTALLLACQKGNFQIAKLLLENGSDPSIVDQTGLSVLHFLCIFRDEEIKSLSAIIQSCKPGSVLPVESFSKTVWSLPDFWDDLYGTPLQWAVTAANSKAVEELLNLGAKPLHAPGWLTPIQIASGLFLSDIVRMLLAKLDSFDPRSHGLFYLNEAHPFRPILIHGKNLPQAIRDTIEQLAVDKNVDIMTPWGLTPLMRISMCNFSFTDVLIVEELLKHCDRTIEGPHFSTIAASIMGCNNSPSKTLSQIAMMIINAGFSPRAVSDETTSCPGWNSMHFAASGRLLDVVKTLYAKDPELLTIPASYETKEYPLHVAAHSPYGADMVKLLLNLNADPLARGGYGHTPLMSCIGHERLQLDMEKLELLLEANAANGYVVQGNSFTVVDVAALRSAQFNHEGLPGYELLAYILSRPELKELVNMPNEEGMTTLQMVCACPDYTTLKLLVEAGADPLCTTPEPDPLSPLRLVLEFARKPEEGWAGRDLGSVWHKFAYHAACYLAEVTAGTAQDERMTPLHIAAHCGFAEEVERLVEQDKANLQARDATGSTPEEMLTALLKFYHERQVPIHEDFLVRVQKILVYLNEQLAAIGEHKTNNTNVNETKQNNTNRMERSTNNHQQSG